MYKYCNVQVIVVDKLAEFKLVREDVVGWRHQCNVDDDVHTPGYYFKNLAAAATPPCQAYNLLMVAQSLRL